MVNKGSFFQRLKERWGSGSGVRIEKPAEAKPQAGRSPVTKSRLTEPTHPAAARAAAPAAEPASRVAPQPPKSEAPKPEAPKPEAPKAEPQQPKVEAERFDGDNAVSTRFQPAEARSTRKMSDREEAMLAVGHHFQELAALMRGAQAQNDEKLQKIVEATSSMPALGKQQLEALQALSVQMDKQNALGLQLSATMTRLPGLLENVEKALDRAAKTDERTAATVKEFQATMDRIHTSMDKMVAHSGEQAQAAKALADRREDDLKGLADNVAKVQQGAVEELKRANEQSLQSLRRTHEDQSNRLQRIVQENNGWNRAVLVGIGLVVLGIGAVIALQLVS